MKRYRKFMDGVKASDTLNQRLRALKEPKKKPAWTKYGALAAAFILVFGLGGYGLQQWTTAVGRQLFLDGNQVYIPEDTGDPDIAPVESGASDQQGLGSYEYDDPRLAGLGVTSFRMLPYIDYGTSSEAAEQKIAMDWAIQKGAVERELSQEEIIDLLGGQDVVSVHLDWDAYELSGRLWERPDGSILMVLLGGYQGPLDHFEFSVMDGGLPPTCIAYAGSVTQVVHGLTVTADKYDGEQGCERRVSFLKDEVGYRFDLTSTDAHQAEVLVSRLVCQAAEGGLCSTGKAEAAPVSTVTCPTCGKVFPAGEEKAHVHSFTSQNNSVPAISADPSYSAPPVSAEPSDTCPECGVTYPAGEAHYHTQTCEICGETYPEGTPHSHTCPECGKAIPAGQLHEHSCETDPIQVCDICGKAVHAGEAHGHGICGLPLAPDTHTCEICGQVLPAGVEHSHQQEHHQEQHRGGHH